MNNKTLAMAGVLLVFSHFVLLSKELGGFYFDIDCFRGWALNIYRNGLANTYDIFNDYLPLYQYVLYLYGKIAGGETAVADSIFYIKAFTTVFDFAGLWFVYIWIGRKTDYLLLLVISMFNTSFSYNTQFWGQIDGIHSAMIFVSLYHAGKQRIMLSVCWYLLAVNTKLQAIIFSPVMFLSWLLLLTGKQNWKQLFYILVLAMIIEGIILLPFILDNEALSLLWNKVILGSFGRYPMVGDCNFWSLAGVRDGWHTSDSGIFVLGLSYKQTGLLLFGITSLFAMYPLLKKAFASITQKKAITLPSKEILWLICALIAILFFFFNTQMHERYSHPAWLFLTAYAFYSGRFLAYILFSIAYFLVLERGLHWLGLKNYDTVIFHPVFIGVLFAILITCLFAELYRKTMSRKSPDDFSTLAISKPG